MIPKRVTLENFLSFGAKQDLVFDDDEPLWVVGGPNGVGKSAVFDAITFCLFGAHRGGKGQGMDDLVRHGANGFFVQFEFAFGGATYQITRNHKVKGRPTARVEQQAADGSWKAVVGVNTAAELKGWSERTLGLPVEAFAASVLLKQGEADEILKAGGARRLEILKKIIGAERYEALSKRVHDAAATKAVALKALQTRRETMPVVTDEQLAEADLKQRVADDAKALAEAAKADAVQRVGLAKQWATHEDSRRELAQKVAAADARAADAGRIQRDKQRLDELNRVLPTLAKLIPVRDTLPATEESLKKLREDHRGAAAALAELTNQIEGLKLRGSAHRITAGEHGQAASKLREEIAKQEKFLKAAEAVAKLDARVQAFDPTLDSRADELRTKLAAATEGAKTFRDAMTKAQTLLDQATKEQTRFADVAVGVECSRCGQIVSPEHAAKERADIADRIRRHGADSARAEGDWAAAGEQITATTDALKGLAATIRDRDSARQQLELQRKALEDFGGTSDADKLRTELAAADVEAKRLESLAADERAKQKKLEDALKVLEPQVAPLEKKDRDLAAAIQKAETKHTTNAATCAALQSHLPDAWQATTADALEQYIREHERLADSGVTEQFQLWQQDAARRDEWVGQLAAVAKAIDAIPEPARISETDAERLQKAAADAAKLADTALSIARDELRDLTQQAKDLADLKDKIVAAEAEARVHGRLDELLGKKKLQRELVRQAEAEIVRLANDTVRNLSGGDLSIELDHGEDSADEAFALRVRRDDSPPIDVAYLSGSQKFRVAVAVALAIGRFAAGQARPLECVIIDEGFGSLDKDGLRATAEELNNLKQHLRRIILVSHQEDFTGHFPVVYRLSKGEHGTTAEKVRR